MTQKFIMMVGISGSGKGYFASQLAIKYNAVVFESDDYRKIYYGSAAIQGDNTKLFEALHSDMIITMRMGKNVIFDATNISMKHRVAFLQKIAHLDVEKIAVVIATPIPECHYNNEHRKERVVPTYVINNMYKQFQCPGYFEGWDNIIFVNNTIMAAYQEKYSSIAYIKSVMDTFEQRNPNHSKTVGKHCDDVAMAVLNEEFVVRIAARWHDLGKIYTQVFADAKGNPSPIAHYYSHENVGSYEMMLYSVDAGRLDNDKDIALICNLIQYHMRPYAFETSEKARKKFYSLVGQEIYDGVMAIYNADKNSK